MNRIKSGVAMTAVIVLGSLNAKAQTGINGARLEANLGFVEFDNYLSPNNNQITLTPNCTGTYQECMRTVLANYAAQGVTGVRFFFDIAGYAGDASKPFNSDGTLCTAWLNNLSQFFHDLKTAKITNITPSPAMSGDTGTTGNMGIGVCIDGFNPATRIWTQHICDSPDIIYYPWLPWGVIPWGQDHGGYPYQYADPMGYYNAPSLSSSSDPTLIQKAWGWQDAGCASWQGGPDLNGSPTTWHGGPNPPNCSQFILWFRQLMMAAHLEGLNVEEVDLSNESDLSQVPVLARLIYDNQSSGGTAVFQQLDNIMSGAPYYFPAGRVTFSANANYPAFLNSSDAYPLHDCPSFYGDSQALIGETELIAATGWGYVGVVTYNPDDIRYHLACFTSQDPLGALQLIPPYGNGFMFTLPPQGEQTISDIHITPDIPAQDCAGAGICGVWGSFPPADVQEMASLIYSDFWKVLENHSPPTCPQCTDLRQNIVMMGETSGNNPNVPSNDPSCPAYTSSNAFGLVDKEKSLLARDEQGQSHLANVVLRPWERLNPDGAQLYEVPANIGWPNGPYNPCTFTLSGTSANVQSGAGSGYIWLTETGSCQWSISSDATSWLTVSSYMPQTGSGYIWYSYTANTGAARVGHLTIAGPTFGGNQLTVTQNAASTYTISGIVTLNGAGIGNVTVTLSGSQGGSTITNGSGGYSFPGLAANGNYTLTPAMAGYTMSPASQTFWSLASNQIANFTATSTGPSGLEFYPITPCRIADTRVSSYPVGLGPPSMSAGQQRSFPVLSSNCGVPSTAAAYSLNITVVPWGSLANLTVWPSGPPLPNTSTLSSTTGTVVSNSTIVAAGTSGAISIYTSDATDVLFDINGYFAPPVNGMKFYTVTPCRVADTRVSSYPAGLGPPSMYAGETRPFPVLSSACGIPSSATAYSFNFTVVPSGYLGVFTVWPSGQAEPNVSTLNSYDGRVVANAAIVPAGSGGEISINVTDPTNVLFDTNGYFAPPAFSGLQFYPMTPCRVADTRGNGYSGSFGPPTMSAGSQRSFPIQQSSCNIPTTAVAYALSISAVPRSGQLGILITWPSGQAQPNVSTMNSYDGRPVANAAIVPAGTGGAINLYVTDNCDIMLDVSGYFAP